MDKAFTTAAVFVVMAIWPAAARAQGGGRLRVPSVAPTASASQTGVNHAVKLKAAPLLADSLARPVVGGATSTYSVPYGPQLTRPAGSASVPFGSSRYYYRR